MTLAAHSCVYNAFGLKIWSDARLPYKETLDQRIDGVDVFLRRVDVLQDVLSECVCLHAVPDFEGGPVLRVFRSDDGFFVDYAGWLVCVHDVWGGEVHYVATEPQPKVPWSHVVERVVLPLTMLWRNDALLALHGGAIAYKGRAFALIGRSGAGKSTSTHAFLEVGAKILSDDMLLVDAAHAMALPGAPSLRLFEHLGPVARAVSTHAILGMSHKRWYRLPDEDGVCDVLPLAAIVLLEPQEKNAPMCGACTPMSGILALVALLEQTFDLEHPLHDWASARLLNARTLLERVPMWRCSYTRSLDGSPAHLVSLRTLLEESV